MKKLIIFLYSVSLLLVFSSYKDTTNDKSSKEIEIYFDNKDLIFESNNKPLNYYNCSNIIKIDSVKVIVHNTRIYILPPTPEDFRKIGGYEDSVFVIFPNDSFFSRPLFKHRGIKQKAFGYKNNLFESFLVCLFKANSNSINEKGNKFDFSIGVILIDYYYGGKIEKSIFVDRSGNYMLDYESQVGYNNEMKIIFKQLFYYCTAFDY